MRVFLQRGTTWFWSLFCLLTMVLNLSHLFENPAAREEGTDKHMNQTFTVNARLWLHAILHWLSLQGPKGDLGLPGLPGPPGLPGIKGDRVRKCLPTTFLRTSWTDSQNDLSKLFPTLFHHYFVPWWTDKNLCTCGKCVAVRQSDWCLQFSSDFLMICVHYASDNQIVNLRLKLHNSYMITVLVLLIL